MSAASARRSSAEAPWSKDLRPCRDGSGGKQRTSRRNELPSRHWRQWHRPRLYRHPIGQPSAGQGPAVRQTRVRHLLVGSVNQRQAGLGVTDHDHLRVGAAGQLDCGLDALPLEQLVADALRDDVLEVLDAACLDALAFGFLALFSGARIPSAVRPAGPAASPRSRVSVSRAAGGRAAARFPLSRRAAAPGPGVRCGSAAPSPRASPSKARSRCSPRSPPASPTGNLESAAPLCSLSPIFWNSSAAPAGSRW